MILNEIRNRDDDDDLIRLYSIQMYRKWNEFLEIDVKIYSRLCLGDTILRFSSFHFLVYISRGSRSINKFRSEEAVANI